MLPFGLSMVIYFKRAIRPQEVGECVMVVCGGYLLSTQGVTYQFANVVNVLRQVLDALAE